MSVSLRSSGQAIADLSSIGDSTPAASNVARGLPLTMLRRFRVTQPARPSPFLMTRLSSLGASTPAAKRHRSVSLSWWYKNKVQADHGPMLVSFDEMSAIVYTTPRLLLIA